MKRILLGLLVVAIALGLWGWGIFALPALAAQVNSAYPTQLVALIPVRQNPIDKKLTTEYGSKLDLNNSNVLAFQNTRGSIPTWRA